jgi:hypothetical protein
MKRLLVVPLLVAAAVVLLVGPAAAAVTPDTYTPGPFGPAPSGTHLQSGTISCTVNPDLSVDCGGYQLNGVGNTNAVVSLIASYSATIDCNNPGNNRNNPIESHTTNFSANSTATVTPTRNGRLNVAARSVSPFSVAQGCPNPNWKPVIRDGTLVLNSFSYTLTFVGFGSPYITIAAQ